MGFNDKQIPLKRKKNSASKARKKPRVERTAEQLPWKKSRRPLETGLGGDDGILELEEVEDVEVVYEMTEGGKVAKFRVSRCAQADAPFGHLKSHRLLNRTHWSVCGHYLRAEITG
jgi:ATP-dependent RNA helicase DDX24/MAK5